MSNVEPIVDSQELNRTLAADPELKKNMLEHGLIAWGPMLDHNDMITRGYFLTEKGKAEMRQRTAAAMIYRMSETAEEERRRAGVSNDG